MKISYENLGVILSDNHSGEYEYWVFKERIAKVTTVVCQRREYVDRSGFRVWTAPLDVFNLPWPSRCMRILDYVTT
jgi:hypothetical protein